jgi:hypothetical protein
MCPNRLLDLRHYLHDNSERDSITTLFRRVSDVGLGYTLKTLLEQTLCRSVEAQPSLSCSLLQSDTSPSRGPIRRCVERITELPHLMCAYVSEGLGRLGNSACNDLANRNALGFLTRQRQIQELYIKTLCLLLIADPPEQEHMVSGEMPNGMSAL